MPASILSGKRVLIVDNGAHVSWALKLLEYGAQVFYFSPWIEAAPRTDKLIVGMGFEGVTRLKSWEAIEDTFDLFIFMDIYFGATQFRLRKAGKRVWGSGLGENIELYRWECKKLIDSLGMPVGQCWRVVGMQALRDLLKTVDDCYIKISSTRGEFETFHHENKVINGTKVGMSEDKLTLIEHSLGCYKDEQEFIVEAPIDSVCECGFDGWTIDGQFPSVALLGVECKARGLLGVFKKYEDFPDEVKYVNEKLAPIFKQYGYRGDFSSEIRVVKDGTPEERSFFIDATCRKPVPPNEVLQEGYANWDEIYWHGADGKMVDPIPVAKYGCEAVISSDDAWTTDIKVHIEDHAKPFVKLFNWYRDKDGLDHFVQQEGSKQREIGFVVGLGDTIEEAYEHLKKNAEAVSGSGITVDTDSIIDALSEIKRGDEAGIKFTDDEIPKLEK